MKLYRGNAVSIAGSDSGGGAGIQADLKTWAALKIFGMTAITAVTAQNSTAVSAIWNVPPEMVRAQMDALWSDFTVNAAKIGMVSCPETIHEVAEGVRRWSVKNLVLDPVMISQSGFTLMEDEGVAVLTEELLPLALLVTPNVPEAERLASMAVKDQGDMEKAALAIGKMGPQAVLVKGGHLPGETTVTDVLSIGGEITVFTIPGSSRRIPTNGCTSAPITGESLRAFLSLRLCGVGRNESPHGAWKNFRPGRGWGPGACRLSPDRKMIFGSSRALG
ncbi:bifunctional hydroxymethylpyrimidine kinase/phosphomethylpyrimidine kinase [Aminivibrio sp.]